MACPSKIAISLVRWNAVLTAYGKSPSIIHAVSHVAMSLNQLRRRNAHATPNQGILILLLVMLKIHRAVPLLRYHRLHMIMHHEQIHLLLLLCSFCLKRLFD